MSFAAAVVVEVNRTVLSRRTKLIDYYSNVAAVVDLELRKTNWTLVEDHHHTAKLNSMKHPLQSMIQTMLSLLPMTMLGFDSRAKLHMYENEDGTDRNHEDLEKNRRE